MFSRQARTTPDMLTTMFAGDAKERGERIKTQVKELYSQYEKELSNLNSYMSQRDAEQLKNGEGTLTFRATEDAIANTIARLEELHAAYTSFDEEYRDATGKEISMENKRADIYKDAAQQYTIDYAAKRQEEGRKSIERQYNEYET